MPMLCWCSVYCSNLSRMTHDQCCLKAKCSSCWQNKPGALIIVFCLQKLVWHGLFAKFKPVPKLETDWCFQLKDDESTRLHNGSLKRSNRVAPEVLQRKACFPQPNGTNTCVSQLSSGEATLISACGGNTGTELNFAKLNRSIPSNTEPEQTSAWLIGWNSGYRLSTIWTPFYRYSKSFILDEIIETRLTPEFWILQMPNAGPW